LFTKAGDGRFLPYERDEKTLARRWAVPGHAGLEHRVGGLEKEETTGDVSYDPENHQRMTELRQEKVRRIAGDIPPVEVDGPESGRVLVLGWGSTRGPIAGAVRRKHAEGKSVSWVHLRHMNPLPRNLGEVIGRFDKVLIPEMNMGQLEKIVRMEYLIEPAVLHKVQGRPFLSREIAEKLDELLEV
jgi:2-oxoglutarate ferredoxin oxidoreductase subunit alpha